jgi:excisionase family DNA binding protein
MTERRRLLEATLASLRACVALLEAELARPDAEQAPGPSVDISLSLQDAAAQSHLSPHTLRTWVRSGRLPAVKGARGQYRVRPQDIQTALAADPVTPLPRRTKADAANDIAEWDRRADAQMARLCRQ